MGEFVGYEDGKVRIRSAEGRHYRIALELLSQADQMFVQAHLCRLVIR
ncbi:MAG: hypothetical protein NZ602_09970 [Thermoguttaceae bacterium]|nr:hypothetical protein [Thermoguttaceae bacterium]